ncbi:MAG: kaiB domain protein [Actinomycetia bacterium]|nr:kaiB domain protein [Actinomycetes bacterium]
MTTPREVTYGQVAADLDERYALTLFVSGASALSARAIANARQLCDHHLDGRYHLSVVDLHENPAGALEDEVFVAPTLLRRRPWPGRRFVGDLSQAHKVILALGLQVAGAIPTRSG